jgi:ribosomal protein L27
MGQRMASFLPGVNLSLTKEMQTITAGNQGMVSFYKIELRES